MDVLVEGLPRDVAVDASDLALEFSSRFKLAGRVFGSDFALDTGGDVVPGVNETRLFGGLGSD